MLHLSGGVYWLLCLPPDSFSPFLSRAVARLAWPSGRCEQDGRATPILPRPLARPQAVAFTAPSWLPLHSPGLTAASTVAGLALHPWPPPEPCPQPLHPTVFDLLSRACFLRNPDQQQGAGQTMAAKRKHNLTNTRVKSKHKVKEKDTKKKQTANITREPCPKRSLISERCSQPESSDQGLPATPPHTHCPSECVTEGAELPPGTPAQGLELLLGASGHPCLGLERGEPTDFRIC